MLSVQRQEDNAATYRMHLIPQVIFMLSVLIFTLVRAVQVFYERP